MMKLLSRAANTHLSNNYEDFITNNCCCGCCPRAATGTLRVCTNKKCDCRKAGKICTTCDDRCSNPDTGESTDGQIVDITPEMEGQEETPTRVPTPRDTLGSDRCCNCKGKCKTKSCLVGVLRYTAQVVKRATRVYVITKALHWNQ